MKEISNEMTPAYVAAYWNVGNDEIMNEVEMRHDSVAMCYQFSKVLRETRFKSIQNKDKEGR